MKFKIGDLVETDDQAPKLGVIVSNPIATPRGYTVRVAFDGKILSMYTWGINPVEQKRKLNKHFT